MATLTVSEDFAVDEDESEHDPQDAIQCAFLPLVIAQDRSRRAIVVSVSISIGVPFAQDAPERFLPAVVTLILILIATVGRGEGEVRVPVRLDVSEEGEGHDRPDDVRFRLRCGRVRVSANLSPPGWVTW